MRTYHYWVVLTALVAFSVITAGAWVRLTDAGLGCPDWPGCYGNLLVPEDPSDLERANQAFPERPVETGKAWREMLHRYMASGLGLLILGLAVAAIVRRRRDPLQPLGIPVALVALVIFQGMLGKWTVTLLLKPLIVMGHLLGGFATLSLLVWLALQTRFPDSAATGAKEAATDRGGTTLRITATLALIVLVMQVALGGWTSTNYAALACPDFPMCQNQWLPENADYAEAFVMWRGLGIDYEGGVLAHPARVAIHFSHRIGAIVTLLVLLWATVGFLRNGSRHVRRSALFIQGFLAVQILLGIAIVKYALPLALAVAHNGNAALLMVSVVAANFFIWRSSD